MSKYQVDINNEQYESATDKASNLGLSVQEYITYIVHNHLDALHSIKIADFQNAYFDDILLGISDI
ncbi:MAG: hypothetical protein FWF56_03975 [Firmicutes bacterium]|nr:hypothetical protein [Bacillota bacterium]MCL1944943.1 hypothetical protein [Bacillota bacterium]MCL1953450.1 hypothetical protein [Bacillota bacterium]